jgi:hypothetical protein
MKTQARNALAVVPLLLSLACGDAARAPAEAAMAAASSAAGSLRGEAEKYAPDAVGAVQSSYASAKDLIERRDYQGALAIAGDIPARSRAALATATARKDELTKAWGEYADTFQKMVAAIQERIASLSSARKLPAGIDRAAIAKAREGVASIESGWRKASEMARTGDFTDAIAMGKELNARALELLQSIGM